MGGEQVIVLEVRRWLSYFLLGFLTNRRSEYIPKVQEQTHSRETTEFLS